MDEARTCSRCHETIPTGLPRDGWTNRVFLRRPRFTLRHSLRFDVWSFRWLPEDPQDRARRAYTELDLCNDCAVAVFDFAQGRTA